MSGLEVVGAAASIVGLAQAGLGLAKALNEYVGAVSDANDDIAIIADDIYATYRHLNDLAWVLKQNDTTKCMTEDAVTSAQTCAKKAEVLVQKLRKLLVKGGGNSMNTSDIHPDDIDITKFRRGIWYIYKSEFELRQAQLHSIKTDISMVYLGYLAMSSATTKERAQATEEMELLFNRQTALNRGIEKARKKRDRDAKVGSKSHTRPVRPSHYGMPDYSDNEEELYEDYDGPEVIYDTIDDVYKEFDNWVKKKQESDADKASELKKTQQDAVSQYLKEQKDAEEQVSRDMDKLRKALNSQGVPPGRVDQIVKAAYPGAGTQPTNVANGANTSVRPFTGSNVPSKRASIRRPSWFRRSSQVQAGDDSSNLGSVPDVLKDAALPGGFAQLKALYFQKINVAPGWTEITKLDLAIPDYRLIPQLLCPRVQHPISSLTSSFLHGFAEVPEDYRYHILKELTNACHEDGDNWTVLHIETVKSQQSRMKFSRKSKSDIVGTYVILRKVSAPDDFFSMGASTTGEIGPNIPVQTLPQVTSTVSKAAIEEPSSQSVARLDLIPEQAETYVDRRERSRGKERDLRYSSSSRRSEYAPSGSTRRRPSSPRHVSFVEDETRTEPLRTRSRSRYADTSDDSDYANTGRSTYAARSRSRRDSATPSTYARTTYRAHENVSDNGAENPPRTSIPVGIPMSVHRRGESPSAAPAIFAEPVRRRSSYRPYPGYGHAPEPTKIVIQNYPDVRRGRHSRADGRASPAINSLGVRHTRLRSRSRSRSRSSSRSRDRSIDRHHRHAYSDSSGDDRLYENISGARRISRRNTSPRRDEYMSHERIGRLARDELSRLNAEDVWEKRHMGEEIKPIEERRKLEAIREESYRRGKMPRRIYRAEVRSDYGYPIYSRSQSYGPASPIHINMGEAEARRTSPRRRSPSRMSIPAVYHYGTRSNSRSKRRHNESPTRPDLRAMTSNDRPDADNSSIVSSENSEYIPASRPGVKSKEAVRTILESWTNKAAQVPPKDVDAAKQDGMPSTGPFSRRTTFDVDVEARDRTVDLVSSGAKKSHVESEDENDTAEGGATEINGHGNDIHDVKISTAE